MKTLEINEIVPDKNQPRKYFGLEKMASLKDSIKRHGIITPLTVQKEGDHYLLIDGERRFRAATQLKMKEVPVNIIEPKDSFTRLLEQFHIQEQHESWSPTEKAMAILEICEVSKKSLKDVCDMLSIEERMARYYTAFAKLQNKDRFLELNISIYNAEKIHEVKNFVRNIKENVLGETFTKAQENVLEKALIKKIADKEIAVRGDYSRIKDSFRSNPKLIEKFLKDDFNIDEQFIKSNAKAARYMRNLVTSCNYVISNGSGFIKDPNVKPTEADLSSIRRCEKVCKTILSMVE